MIDKEDIIQYLENKIKNNIENDDEYGVYLAFCKDGFKIFKIYENKTVYLSLKKEISNELLYLERRDALRKGKNTYE